MVSTTYPKQTLLSLAGASEKEVVDALPDIKCNVESVEPEAIGVEVTGDRPDLLSVYGAARALKGYLSLETGMVQSDYAPSGVKVFVEPEAEKLRPVIVGAIVENVRLDDVSIQHLFQVQEKLDLTNGRRRKKVSIGLYDMSSLKAPFYLKAADPALSFHPLKSEKPMTLRQILCGHPTGKDYAHLLPGKKYPVLMDSKGEVMSLVPIINGVSSSVTEKTRTLFIDHTGTDLHACNTSLNILCRDFEDMGASVKTVEVHHSSKKLSTPDTKPEKFVLRVDKVNKVLGTTLTPKQVVQLLRRQRLDVSVGRDVLECFVPRYRADFLHEIDLVEEVCLAHGFNNFQLKEPSVFTVGGKSAQTYASQCARDALNGFGCIEMMTHVFFSPSKAAKAFASEDLVAIRNPVSDEYSSLRSFLMPSLLEALSKNTHEPYPQKVFEVGEVVVKDPASETRTRTDVNACLITAHASSGLSEAASLLEELSRQSGFKYSLKELSHKRFIEGRAASIVSGKETIGFVGELHPHVLENYALKVPVSVFEVRLVKGER